MIDYNLLALSIEHYGEWNFKRIEVPWTVSQAVNDITMPEGKQRMQFSHNDKCFVGSAEQSFLYLYLKEFLPKGKYQAVTPCLRYENFDELHTKYFMKNELIDTLNVGDNSLIFMMNHALRFFCKFLPEAKIVKVKDRFPNENAHDIVYKGIELGSYGRRKCDFLVWLYGTGCAEPRLSKILQQNGISYKRNSKGEIRRILQNTRRV